MNFTRITDMETSTYKRWRSDCSMFIITWYKYQHKNQHNEHLYVTDPHYECYRRSMSFPGSSHLKTFEDAVTACEKDAKEYK